MKVKLDENIPVSAAPLLAALGHDVETVTLEGLSGCEDAIVWDAAQREGRFLVTQDLDFSDIHRFAPGTHAGLLLLRLKEPGRRALLRRLVTLFEMEQVGAWRGCVVVATERKIRVRRPPSPAGPEH